MPLGAILALIENDDYERVRQERVQRRHLRDCSDPMSLSDSVFVSYYRVNKEAFSFILLQIEPQLRSSSIPVPLQLAATLRYLAVGAYQAVIGRYVGVSLARTTVCKVLWKTITILERTLCEEWIDLQMSEEETRECKKYFFEKYRLPGVAGCIDGTHFRLLKPSHDESLFLNRKGYFSVNAMIICDHKMRIRCIDACRPGSSHDALVWKVSGARAYVHRKYFEGDQNSWFLADSGYPLEPFLLTPFRDPSPDSVQHVFNRTHSSARNIVERTIGVLKSRFRCLQMSLPYNPEKVVKIVNVTCGLHNVCNYFRADIEEDPVPMENSEFEIVQEEENLTETSLRDRQVSVRNEIAYSLRQF